MTIRPDVLIEHRSAPLAVADVKYKRPSTSGVANHDIYQVLSYARRYGLTGCSLIYAEQPPYEELKVGDVTVRLDWLDLRQPPDARAAALGRLAERLVPTRLNSTSTPTAHSQAI